jgi:XTP/dITP diphosphohydrolase
MPASADTPQARRLERGARVVAATHNAGKVRELRELLAPYGLSVTSAADFDLPEPEETGTTFTANAELKARAAAAASGLPALADDSGLEVHILDGAPGIFAARWAGPGRDFGLAMQRVADEVRARGGWTQEPGPRANFTAVLCLAWPDGTAQSFEGKVYGHLVWPPRGSNGFGYDPMFLADGETLTFGEMEPAKKHAISHRARAFALFSRACLEGG